MANNNPRVSIGLPVYNGERFISETLDSILNQTFSDFELIICDNASNDRTPEICKSYLSKDKRIRYYRNDSNLGANKNFNLTFELSTGEYFKWVAADDPCHPEFLSRCLEILDKEPEVILCYPRTIIIDENGKILEKYDNNLYLKAFSPSGRFLQYFFNAGLVTPIFGLIRIDTLKKTRLFGQFLGSDNILISELCLLGKFKEIPEYLYYKRLHSDSSMGLIKINDKVIITKDNLKQFEFYNPYHNDRVILPSWKILYEHLISVKRSPISMTAKLNLILFLLGTFISNINGYVLEVTERLKSAPYRSTKIV